MATTRTAPFLVLLCLATSPGCQRQSRAPCICPGDEPVAAPEELEEELYALPDLDHGLLQSPVNILSGQAVDGSHKVVLHFDHTAPDLLVNKGTTIELDFPQGGGSLNYDGREYDLEQLHFHTPSEHQVDGITYPMEMHIVHRLRGEAEHDQPRFLVVAILFRMSDPSHFIGAFLEAVPQKAGQSKHMEPGEVYLDELFPGFEMPRYYHYRGSLTTPPHTESVHWLVLKQVMSASSEQIRRINAIEGDNARHVQALYGRPID